uniref:Uncharacterized protein n=1 Tax=Triticum urartu TaxID=4572 RepID=A0A8R7UN28_TRIUA
MRFSLTCKHYFGREIQGRACLTPRKGSMIASVPTCDCCSGASRGSA